MATKTFKIGLSNTDKQNMAQDVYERLLALTFPEYDTTTEYEVGDFVVYNDQLYKCIGATTGAWDSSKWQLATLNDLVSDIEDAVQFVNDKANVDGNYPTMTVGVADNLSPYDETSGINQHEPFNFQASGTNNGSDPTATVGELAIMSEKRGNTVVVNQLNSTPSISQTFVAQGEGSEALTTAINFVSGHKYLISCNQSATMTSNVRNLLLLSIDMTNPVYEDGGENHNLQGGYRNCILTANLTGAGYIYIWCHTPSNEVTYTDCRVIDLTQWFNGDIPQDLLDNPEHFFRYYQGSLAYNEGELVNANSRYLKAIGRNQWDEENLQGYYDASTGVFVSASGNLASKNAIKVIPNTTYKVFRANTPQVGTLCFYDANDNFISTVYFGNDTIITTPSNAVKAQLSIGGYGTSYNNDVCVSIYYEGESGYDQYYPYEELTNNDTGSEVLRSAGSVCDIKLPSGEIKRNVGTVTPTHILSGYNRPNGDFLGVLVNNAYAPSNSTLANMICVSSDNSVELATADNQYSNFGVANNCIAVAADGQLYLCVAGITNANDMNTWLSNVSLTIYYELADASKTTEQGTPYSENVAIDDFGSMDFSGTSGVPQGNALFYPVDYKAYLDTLHNYTDGDPDNLALKSDLTGLVSQEDLSSTVRIIDENQGLWTTDYKKLIKTGDLYTLNLCVTNATGDTLLTSDIAEIPSINISQKILFSNCELTSYRRVKMLSGSSIETNGKLYVNISWVNK